jgi:hypothetical protein
MTSVLRGCLPDVWLKNNEKAPFWAVGSKGNPPRRGIPHALNVGNLAVDT